MNIGLDLDNTLVHLKTIEEVAKENNLPYTDADCDDWNLSNFPKDFVEKVMEKWNDPEHMCSVIPIPGAISTVSHLKDIGYDIHIITARNKPVREGTKELVGKYFPKIDSLHFVNYNESKTYLRKYLELDIWVDDSPIECHASVYEGIKTYMISNEHTKYNWYLRDWNKLNVIGSIYEI